MLHFGSRHVIIVSSADAAREIMKTNDLIFCNKPRLTLIDRLLYQGKDVASASYGEYWRQIRSICVLQLLSTKRVQSYRGIREEELALLIDNVKQSYMLSLPVNLSDLFSLLNNDVICRVAFGKKCSGGNEGAMKFKKLLRELMELLSVFSVGDFIPWLSWINRFSGLDARVERVSKELDTFLDTVVEEHMVNLSTDGDICGEGGEDRQDFVDVLLEEHKNSIVSGSSIDRDGMKALILDMFAGGTDTTSTVIEWAMTELVRHPRVMERLRNEVMGIASGKQDITESDLDKMPYLKAVIKETLRLYPPLPLVFRESTQDAKIKGYDIAAKTMVIVSAWTIGRDPSLWDEPEEFQPDRFMNSCVDFKGQDFQLIPFGAGRRGCPGILFAMTTTELVLANLVHRFEWSLPSGARAEDMNMTESVGFVIHREVPLIAMAVPRSS
ncbi:hypothetical protein ACLB2K_071547 [Fragaria x ananassa]